MKVLFMTCAKSAIIDGATDRLSLFNIAEEVGVASVPVVVPSLAVVLMVTRRKNEPENDEIVIEADANGKKFLGLHSNFPFKASYGRATSRFYKMCRSLRSEC